MYFPDVDMRTQGEWPCKVEGSHMSELPLLSRVEHLELERLARRPLTNNEAQMLRRELTLEAAFHDWLEAKRTRDYGRDAGAVQPPK